MERIRVAGIIPMENGIALMHRKDVIKRNDYQEYYTFPGGGLESGETPEEGTIREIKEEFGINVRILKKMYEIKSEKFNQLEIFYLCEYIDGKFGTGKVLIMPAKEGTGVIAGGPARAVLELAGYKDIKTKVIGTNNPRNVVYATINALQNMSTIEQTAKKRDKKAEEII